ncbi:hypothetical protein BCV72DRAFT_302007 [Rhizopus microsporus var. microsporus]|uniref:MULE transposase domain-containing protein n=2 Tax=Rhizopus microsporus TaxID=58291 RepID=A0A2G4T9V8_RHIZD|nr:uncharacterized protein RHIMIDRAFT_233225 [Rhizopus microsporus ATCC 52813]ORE10227.1 hypothetical protein BCV72DRAFT_302007 [Rhizopus microsporus var. microsporus]PHZ17801.1 hypothetical protein RHIMIDRAFT_233225 [Rhizopus microsporus ATCC 52813]
MSAAEHATITGVFGSAISIQWCIFHVSKAWIDQIRKKVKLRSASDNNVVHRNAIAVLKSLMWESSTQMLTQELLHFQQEFSMHTDFMAHFTQKSFLSCGGGVIISKGLNILVVEQCLLMTGTEINDCNHDKSN